ncbi:S1C family serine protease [Patescibacteria group bacterium]
MSKFWRRVFNLIIILIIGGLGGIIADYFILPYLAEFPIFSQIEFIQRSKSGTTIINKTEEIVITENIAVEEAVHKINSCLTVVQLYKNNELIKQGSGIIVTNDGLIVTATDLVLSGKYRYSVVLSDGTSIDGEVIKRDLNNNLALIKIQLSNLPVVAFEGLDSLRLGQRIILLGAQIIDNVFYRFVNVGTVRGIGSKILSINLDEKNSSANGGPLINIKGEVIGLNIVGEDGLVRTIPSDIISEFFL